jgi:hypothetical protein
MTDQELTERRPEGFNRDKPSRKRHDLLAGLEETAQPVPV